MSMSPTTYPPANDRLVMVVLHQRAWQPPHAFEPCVGRLRRTLRTRRHRVSATTKCQSIATAADGAPAVLAHFIEGFCGREAGRLRRPRDFAARPAQVESLEITKDVQPIGPDGR